MEHADKTRAHVSQHHLMAERPTVSSETTALADNRPDAVSQRKLAEAIAQSPRMLAQRQQLMSTSGNPVQRQPGEEERPTVQGRFAAVQREEMEREEQEEPDKVQLKAAAALVQTKPEAPPNNTGLPDNLKSGIESLSGMSMDGVKVHYNSSQPAQLNALAYAQGTDIHVAPGQEQHLPHEAWHVVQQAQGRVQPTMQMMDGVAVNDDAGLEHEADVMGSKALATTQLVAEPTAMESVLANGSLQERANTVNQHVGSSPIQQMRQRLPSAKSETYQLVKASELVEIGRGWFAEIWTKGQYGSKQNFIKAIKEKTGFDTGTVFQQYDLYVRGKGPSKYIDIVKNFGEEEAQQFLSFLNDEIDFDDLDEGLHKIAIIVCVSESGRGYTDQEMINFLEKIVSGDSTWGQIKQEYSPSLTYAEDANKPIGEFQPNKDEMDESDDYNEDISKEELEDLKKNGKKGESFQQGLTRSGGNFKNI